jgi:hypothetical protein
MTPTAGGMRSEHRRRRVETNVALDGAIGEPGGYHTVVIDGVSCKMKNATSGRATGCNYTLSGDIGAMGQRKISVTTGDSHCTTTCE